MIKIIINEKETEVDESVTVSGLLEDRQMPKAAVWVNGNQLLKKDYESTTFKDGDKVKVLRIMAGG